MLTFMEKHLSPASGSLNCRSVVLGDREIECGKLLELFYKANNIPYILKCSGDKYNSAYITTIDGMESTIYPKVAFSVIGTIIHFQENCTLQKIKKMRINICGHFLMKDDNNL